MTINAGDRFEVEGKNFDFWPDELVVSYEEGSLDYDEMPIFKLMKLVYKTNTKLIFEATSTHTYGVDKTWLYIGSPFNPPRTLLTYVGI